MVLGLHVDTLRRAAASGTVPSVRLNARGWLRFRVADIARTAGAGSGGEQRAGPFGGAFDARAGPLVF